MFYNSVCFIIYSRKEWPTAMATKFVFFIAFITIAVIVLLRISCWMLTSDFSKTTRRKLHKFCHGQLLTKIFGQTEKQGQKKKPQFMTGIAIGL